MHDKKIEIKQFVFVLIFILIFFMPLLFKTEKVFRDDGAYQAYLKLVGAARYIQNGEIPLWNPDTFCGAKPFYTMYEGPIYNFLLYPFFFIANLNDLNQSFFILLILPFIIAVFFSAAGTFILFRRIFKLTILSSAFASVFYSLSPSMMISIISLHDTFAFATIPWILYFTINFLEKRKSLDWTLLTSTLIILSISNDINYTIRIYFFCFLVSFFYLIFKMKKNKSSISVFLYLIFSYATSIGLTAVMWLGILEGINWINYTGKISFDEIAKEKMNFGNIVSIFSPNFNGIIYGTKAWGESKRVGNSNYIFTGGMFVSFLSFIAIVSIFSKERNKKFWALFFLITLVLTILTMLSDNTPFLRILSFFLPWFFKIPYPHYYYFLQHLSIIVLSSIGFDIILSYKSELIVLLKKVFPIYLILLVIFTTIALFEPTEKDGKIIFSYTELVTSGNLSWFLKEPVIYILLSIIIISFILYFKKDSLIKLIVFFGMLEVVIFGYIIFYKGAISTTRENEAGENDICFEKRFKDPASHPYYNYFLDVEKNLERDNRFTGAITYIDNFAWLKNRYSLFGYDSKPINPLLYNVFTCFMEGYPYQMVPKFYPKAFLKNMNVGYILFKKYGGTNIYNTKELINGIQCEVIKIEDELSFDRQSQATNLLKLEKPLPYIYTQKNIAFIDHKEQLVKLLTEDLKEKVYLSNEDIKETKNYSQDLPVRFYELQEKNKVLFINREHANSLELIIDVKESALLIRNEIFHNGWRVWVDNKEQKLLRANYLQQAVWLDKGVHKVIFKFLPSSVISGLIITVISFIVAIFLLMLKNKFIKAG